MKRHLLAGTFVLALSHTVPLVAAPQTTTFEETDPAWTYSGSWRASSQGSHGSSGSYAVGNATETLKPSSYNGEIGPGSATLDLSGLGATGDTQVELCYISHGNSYRSADTTLTLKTASGDIVQSFSQLGSHNQQVCHNAGAHAGLTRLSLSNETPNNTWATVDFVRVTYDDTPVNSGGFRSTYEPGDLVPNLPMGTTLTRHVYVDGPAAGLGPYPRRANIQINFGRLIVPLDDLDGNGIRELFVSIDAYESEHSAVKGIIVFPDSAGNIIKHQPIDGLMTKNTSWYPTYEPYFGMGAGDFDSNGVKDIVLSQYPAFFQEGRINALLFGRTDDTPAANYTIVGDVELSNNRGNLPFSTRQATSYGSWGHAVGDVDGNGVGDFWTIYGDIDATLRPDLGIVGLQTTLMLSGDGTVLNVAADLLPSRGSNQKIIGDINQDGIPDVVMQRSSADRRNYFLTTLVSNGSSSSFTERTTQIVKEGFANHMSIVNTTAIGDVNGDGNLDVLAAGYPNFDDTIPRAGLTMEIIYLGADGNQSGSPATLFNADEFRDATFFSYSPAVLDLDGDGDLDLAVPAPQVDGGGFYLMYFE